MIIILRTIACDHYSNPASKSHQLDAMLRHTDETPALRKLLQRDIDEKKENERPWEKTSVLLFPCDNWISNRRREIQVNKSEGDGEGEQGWKGGREGVKEEGREGGKERACEGRKKRGRRGEREEGKGVWKKRMKLRGLRNVRNWRRDWIGKEKMNVKKQNMIWGKWKEQNFTIILSW